MAALADNPNLGRRAKPLIRAGGRLELWGNENLGDSPALR
jgi:hypothetical protein